MSVTDAEPIRELMEATRKLEQAYLGSGIPFEIWQKFRGEAGRKVVEGLPILLNLIRERGLGHREDCPLYQAVYAESSGGWFRVRDALPSATLEWLGESLACICRTDETGEAIRG